MSTSCKGLLTKYVECLRSSDCMKVEKKEWKDCVQSHPPECESLRYALFHCRRGQLDARTRIQGNKAPFPYIGHFRPCMNERRLYAVSWKGRLELVKSVALLPLVMQAVIPYQDDRPVTC